MKEDLKQRMMEKILVLKAAQVEIENDELENEKEGQRIVNLVCSKGTLSDIDKLQMHMRETSNITNLLFFLKYKIEATESLIRNDALNNNKKVVNKLHVL